MRRVTVEEVKSMMKQCGNNPNKYSQEELQAIADKYVVLTPQEQEKWEERHRYDD